MRHLRAICIVALLASCKAGPDYRPPPILTNEAPAPPLLSARQPPYDPLAPLPAHWWRLYDDPLLDALVVKALARNSDLRQTVASLEQMQAALREARLQQWPQTSFSASGVGEGSRVEIGGMTISSPITPFYDASESVSYDLDLAGKLKRTAEENRDDVGEAAAMLDLMRVNTAAQTASAYVQACSAGLDIAVTTRSIDVARRMLDLAERKFRAGLTSANDVVQSRATLHQTQAMLPSLYSQQRTSLFMLATMTGDPPDAFPPAVADCVSPPVLRIPIPVGDGAALIARRPDVRSAERKLASAVADIGVKTAQLYPSVKLTASLEALKTNIAGLTTKLLSYSVGTMISWDFPNLSVDRAKVEESKAAARSDLAAFDGKVLTALREAESALETLARDLDTEVLDTQARNDDTTAYANEVRMYQGGIGQFSSVLTAETTLISAERSVANDTASVSKDQVTLFMKLGGGWLDAPPVAETPLDSVERKRP